MSIASQFRDKMDVALTSADRSRGSDPDSRRADLQRDLHKADLVLMEKEMVTALMDRIQELQCVSTVIVSAATCDHQWSYASTVGNMTCIKCHAFRDHEHPDTTAYLNRFPWLRK